MVLSPWHYHISKQPANRYVRKGIFNLRVLASAMYEMFRTRLNSNLPVVLTHQEQYQEQMKMKKSMDGTHNDNLNILSTISEKQHGRSDGSKHVDEKKGVIGGILKVLGVADTTPGYEDFHQGSIEFKLLRPRTSHYETMTGLHMMLLSTQSLQHIESMITEWANDILPDLNSWINDLVLHVIQQQYARNALAENQSPRPNNS